MPPPKSQGATVMTSDFFSEKDGFLAYSDAAWEIKKREPEIAAALEKDTRKEAFLRRAGSVLNVSTDGYYEGGRFLADIEKAMDVIDKNSGGEFRMALLLDHSPIHAAMAEDELNTAKMNVRPGGRQAIMKDGYFYRNGEKVMAPSSNLNGTIGTCTMPHLVLFLKTFVISFTILGHSENVF